MLLSRWYPRRYAGQIFLYCGMSPFVGLVFLFTGGGLCGDFGEVKLPCSSKIGVGKRRREMHGKCVKY